MSLLYLQSSLLRIDSWLLCFNCIPGVLFLLMSCVGLQWVIEVFPDHTHFRFSGTGSSLNMRPDLPSCS